MATKNRTDLKSYFVKNAIPTEGNFADLVDSQLNQAQDGVFKPDGEALSVVAAPGDQKRVLRLYASYPAATPDWMISLNPAQDPANTATTGRPGFGITDGAGKPRLFIDATTGQIGVGTNTPQVALDVAGEVQANGFRGRYDLLLNDYRTVNLTSNICLQSPGNDRDAWIYRDSVVSTSNYGIYHRQIPTAVGGLPGNSIGFVGGSGSTLQAYVNLGDGSGYFAGRLGIGTLAPNGVPGDKIILYDAAANDRYGIGLSSSNINLFCPTAGRFSLRQNSASGTEVFTVSGSGQVTAATNLTAPGGKLGQIGVGNGDWYGSVPAPYETLQLNPIHNLRIWFGTKQRAILENNGQFTIYFDQGYWRFQTDGNLVKYRNNGTGIWALNNVSGNAGW